MMRLQCFRIGLLCLLLLGVTSSCNDSAGHGRAVYLLIDTSGTYAKEIGRAVGIANYLLGTLTSGDSLGLARIDSESFTEKDIVAKVTFDDRPSYSNQQKRAFRQSLDAFLERVESSRYTDITGGMLQAVEWLNETQAKSKYILVFSDLQEELPSGYVRDFDIELSGIRVVALNVTKLRTDQVDPREYLDRLDHWKARVEAGSGTFRVVNDLERLDSLLAP